MSSEKSENTTQKETLKGREERVSSPENEDVSSGNKEQRSSDKKVTSPVKKATTDDNKNIEETVDEDSIYTSKLPNRLVITMNPRLRNRRLFYFLNRARKILRCDETLTITGVDRAISMTCTLVELLKRQKIAQVTKIATNMNLNPNFGRYGGNLAWGQPVPTIVFHLKRDDHGSYVSDYHQRKVIEIFESHDPEHTGKLPKNTIEGMKLGEIFSADEGQQAEARKFLQNRNEIDLPNFIRFCSMLIHPLLKDSVFKEKLVTLGIDLQEDTGPKEAE